MYSSFVSSQNSLENSQQDFPDRSPPVYESNTFNPIKRGLGAGSGNGAGSGIGAGAGGGVTGERSRGSPRTSVGGGGGGRDSLDLPTNDVEDLDEEEDLDLPGFRELYPAHFRKVFTKWHGMTYYPTYWLCFLLMGRPAGKEGRPCLEAGNIIRYLL